MENKAKIDFTKGRGFSAMGTELSADFLKGDPKTALITIAALFGHITPQRANGWSMAMNLLALYAAGALIRLDREQYDALVELVDEYLSIQCAPNHGHLGNVALARYVLNHADTRAKTDGLA